ncbi:hypothetical protein [Halosimplex amylolyticum]|uniref:hypothetical protein n=1 Tax=Halosimplex amylolyticum TaxID=3396616 RepID=UPI003F5430A2
MQIEFGFKSPIGSSELRSMLSGLQQRTDHAVDGELNTVLYIGAESDYLPEQIPPSRAVDYVVEHSQGAIQFQYDGFHYLLHINPSDGPDTADERSSTDTLAISVDGVYFKSDDAVNAADIGDVVCLAEAHTAPDMIVGFGVDTGQGDPTPPIKWFKKDTNEPIPIHWLTYVPTDVTGVSVPSELPERRDLENGTLYFLTDNPTSFKEIKRRQQIMAEPSTER